jgi:hypothetical protein
MKEETGYKCQFFVKDTDMRVFKGIHEGRSIHVATREGP